MLWYTLSGVGTEVINHGDGHIWLEKADPRYRAFLTGKLLCRPLLCGLPRQ